MATDIATWSFFRAHPDPMWVLERDSLRFLDVNPAALRQYGYARETFLGLSLRDLYAPAFLPAALAGATAVPELAALQGRTRHRDRSGRTFAVELLAEALEPPRAAAVMMLARCADAAAVSTEADRRPVPPPPQLLEAQANLRTAQRLLHLGMWKMDLVQQTLQWSPEVFAIYGRTADSFDGSYRAYLDQVHPEDLPAMQASFEAFAASTQRDFQFEHRIRRPDGRIVTVRGIGERTEIDGRPCLVGVVQDVTELRRNEVLAGEADQLLRIAGRAAHLGAWRYRLGEERAWWSEETARIHGEPPGTAPSVAGGIDYYAPEDRERIRARFEACMARGEPFDELLQIITAQGQRRAVRAVGEAERDADGAIVSVRGAFQDLSELVAARVASESMARRLSQTLQHMSDAFYLLDEDLRVVYLNQRAERILDSEGQRLIGERLWDVYPDFPEVLRKAYQRALEDAAPQSLTHLFENPRRWYRINAYPVPEGLAVYFQDITRDHVRGQQLRLLEAAVSRTNDILLITEAEPIDGPDHPRIVYVNEAFTRRTGYTAEEVIGRSPRMLQGPKTQRAELARIRRALKRWEPVRAEVINYTKSGEALWLELDIVPLADENGWYTHWVAIERDVTERKRAEAANRELSERFELIARATQDVIWDWDQRSDQVWWNHSFGRVFGFELARESGSAPVQMWRDLVHPDDRQRVFAGLQRALAGDQVYWEDEYRFIRADGAERYAVDRGHIIRDADGKALRMVGSLMDVTERRELEERLRQSMKMEAIGQLTGGVAHDFNNLLTVILGNAELLLSHLQAQPSLYALAEMTASAAQRGAELTQRLLAFGRRQALRPQVIQVNDLLQRMDRLLRRSLGEQVDIQLRLDEALWESEVDPGQLETAVLNLAINARDAMPKGGRLTIETQNVSSAERRAQRVSGGGAGPRIRITVTDTGTGMSAEVLQRAFDPFFTTKDVGKGSGLGLSMVYGFARQSGGHVWIDSRLGQGTSVHLLLPRARKRARRRAAAESLWIPFGGQERILVVEDNDLVRQHLIAQLQELGYRVESAADAAQAQALLRQPAELDLLLTDIVMPGGMDGRALAQWALAHRPGLKVLFTSGYAESMIERGAHPTRRIPLLSKPYRRHELAQKLRQVLGQPG